ncbi:MAG: hypothetical protein ACRC7D_22275 [Aeromonas popoffii]|uniref:hypothetical protein n=1 Tax=Aeromonas popoffii TaxID=70856 RepID=UPI003F2E83B9
MIIDWTAAPEGTTHATIPNGDPRWYKLADGKVLCWGLTAKEWMPSFFLTVDEIAETGLRLYANGEQSELVMLRVQRDALLQALKDLRGELMATLQENDIDPNYYLAVALSSNGRKPFVDAGKLIAVVEGTK